MATDASAARPGCFPFKKERSKEELKPVTNRGSQSPTTAQKPISDSKMARRKYPAPAAFDSENPVNSLRSLEEALLSISEEPHPVARSTPKGVFVDTRAGASAAVARERDCLFQPPVYEQMLQDSLDVCARLQDNLDDWIDQVRSSTASPDATLTRSDQPPPPSALTPLPALAIPASDSGNGTVSSLNDSLSPLPTNGSPGPSPTKTVTFQDAPAPPPPSLSVAQLASSVDGSSTSNGKRRVLRLKL